MNVCLLIFFPIISNKIRTSLTNLETLQEKFWIIFYKFTDIIINVDFRSSLSFLKPFEIKQSSKYNNKKKKNIP